MKATVARLLVTALLALAPLGLCAQDAAQKQQWRELLAEPIPVGATAAVLRQHFLAKEEAALALDEGEQRETVLRSAVELVPNGRFMNNLARVLLARGQTEEGNALMRKAVAASNPIDAPFRLTNIAQDQLNQHNTDAARKTLAQVALKITAAQTLVKTDSDRIGLLRATGNSALVASKIEVREGHFQQGIDAAIAAERTLREALAMGLLQHSAAEQVYRNEAVANAIAVKMQAYRAAGRLQEAEVALEEYQRFASEVTLSGGYRSGLLATAASLRFSQREFVQSEQLLRESDALLQSLGRAAIHPARTARTRDLVLALSGQQKWPQALQEIDRLYAAAGDDAKRITQVRNDYDDGVVYFGNHAYAQAIEPFERAATARRRQYSESHFFVAQTSGMLGASLWRSGLAANQARALPLLKTAVRDYMAPGNADFLENIGYRKERRDEIFAAYLDAMSSTPGEDATQTLGAADWVRGGAVQEALNDAAVRAAASTPALAGVVREEQDAKNEVAGLHQYLTGEVGGATTPLPAVAAQMRARIATLEARRVALQAQIRAQFPEYAQLVRPSAPGVNDVAKQLDDQQALIMLLPTSDAVYAWAVSSDRPATFARTAMSQAQAADYVQRLRRHLDFGMHADAGQQFDDAAAFALYSQLLAPLLPTWQGKAQLIIAAGGALSQIPFGLLRTQPGTGAGTQAPWLIRTTAVAQVPSLSAWLSIKAIAKTASAPQAFIGWGDPSFGSKATVARQTRSTLRYSDIPALPETRAELLAIAKALKANAARDVFLGDKATRLSVITASQNGELSRARVVAFATHGLMAGDLPHLNQPALALAASATEALTPLAPLLTLEDVLTLKLNADWVVLSACNTAAADGRAEEALSGLARGFFYAGSRSLLVTHWAVESDSAKLLTTATFAHYAANPKAPKAESLRQAMLQVMAQPRHAHPAYWAPFALVGDGGR
jgi:CHAT domain-containing protein